MYHNYVGFILGAKIGVNTLKSIHTIHQKCRNKKKIITSIHMEKSFQEIQFPFMMMKLLARESQKRIEQMLCRA
jgi:hypothetical protein